MVQRKFLVEEKQNEVKNHIVADERFQHRDINVTRLIYSQTRKELQKKRVTLTDKDLSKFALPEDAEPQKKQQAKGKQRVNSAQRRVRIEGTKNKLRAVVAGSAQVMKMRGVIRAFQVLQAGTASLHDIQTLYDFAKMDSDGAWESLQATVKSMFPGDPNYQQQFLRDLKEQVGELSQMATKSSANVVWSVPHDTNDDDTPVESHKQSSLKRGTIHKGSMITPHSRPPSGPRDGRGSAGPTVFAGGKSAAFRGDRATLFAGTSSALGRPTVFGGGQGGGFGFGRLPGKAPRPDSADGAVHVVDGMQFLAGATKAASHKARPTVAFFQGRATCESGLIGPSRKSVWSGERKSRKSVWSAGKKPEIRERKRNWSGKSTVSFDDSGIESISDDSSSGQHRKNRTSVWSAEKKSEIRERKRNWSGKSKVSFDDEGRESIHDYSSSSGQEDILAKENEMGAGSEGDSASGIDKDIDDSSRFGYGQDLQSSAGLANRTPGLQWEGSSFQVDWACTSNGELARDDGKRRRGKPSTAKSKLIQNTDGGGRHQRSAGRREYLKLCNPTSGALDGQAESAELDGQGHLFSQSGMSHPSTSMTRPSTGKSRPSTSMSHGSFNKRSEWYGKPGRSLINADSSDQMGDLCGNSCDWGPNRHRGFPLSHSAADLGRADDNYDHCVYLASALDGLPTPAHSISEPSLGSILDMQTKPTGLPVPTGPSLPNRPFSAAQGSRHLAIDARGRPGAQAVFIPVLKLPGSDTRRPVTR